MVIKLKNLINYILFLIISPFIKSKDKSYLPASMLVIRLDAIGDYILFRNFLQAIKEDSKYRDYKITLCGNIIWKDIAEALDKEYVDSFIWIDRKKFYNNIFYKFSVLKNINKKKYEAVINSTYTREILYGDEIVWASGAPVRIGSKGTLDKHAKWKRKIFSDKYYTRLIASSEKNIFEFYRNKEFFNEILNGEINITRTSCNISKINSTIKLPDKYATLFPGSKDAERRWAPRNFATAAKKLTDEENYYIVIPGGPGDQRISDEIASLLNSKKILNLTGKNSLTDLIKIIAGTDLLISNDTVAVHIAASLNTKFICISSGIYFGRFHPYPKEIYPESYYVYPDIVEENLNNKDFLEKIRYNSSIDINLIKAEKVCKLIDKILPVINKKNFND